MTLQVTPPRWPGFDSLRLVEQLSLRSRLPLGPFPVARNRPRCARCHEYLSQGTHLPALTGDDVTFEALLRRHAFRPYPTLPPTYDPCPSMGCVPLRGVPTRSAAHRSEPSPAEASLVRAREPKFPICGKIAARATLPRVQVYPDRVVGVFRLESCTEVHERVEAGLAFLHGVFNVKERADSHQ